MKLNNAFSFSNYKLNAQFIYSSTICIVTVFVFYFARLWLQLTRSSEFVDLTSGSIR